MKDILAIHHLLKIEPDKAMVNYRESWRAVIEDGVLHISGITDKFPYDFFTSGLERLGSSGDMLLFRLVFHRDKEPFCDSNLVGPVYH
ncbi:MAG: hypothetical protein KY468_16365, partial [Armatimonadetes bacterium]|nr:hypothetical protein [Armatimonadota bacterium]